MGESYLSCSSQESAHTATPTFETCSESSAAVAVVCITLSLTNQGARGFTRANLFRMRQFYEAYRDDEKIAPLASQLPWTHNLIILNRSKRPEDCEVYLRQAIREQ